jgi:hypothetical protein
MAELGTAANEQLADCGPSWRAPPRRRTKAGRGQDRRLNGPWLAPDPYTGCDLTQVMDGKVPAT